MDVSYLDALYLLVTAAAFAVTVLLTIACNKLGGRP